MSLNNNYAPFRPLTAYMHLEVQSVLEHAVSDLRTIDPDITITRYVATEFYKVFATSSSTTRRPGESRPEG
ncbi:MAG: hypothetical protein AAAC48_26655 [Phyllobacterium sp.]|uniref:hypothetical protein n=1 Tax=Phyllobacterium sp. TaxID=1871046 RepID=UPI0030F22EE6